MIGFEKFGSVKCWNVSVHWKKHSGSVEMEQHSKFICKQLPVEIWRKILSHVDQFHLIKNASRVSRLLYAVSNSFITEVMVSDGRVFFGIKDSEHVGKCRGLSSIELASKFETFHKKYKYLNSIHLDKWDMLTKLALQLIDDLKKFTRERGTSYA